MKAINKTCLLFGEEVGWKCDLGGPCIQLDWVCDDQEGQCFPSNDDEVAGCNLFIAGEIKF